MSLHVVNISQTVRSTKRPFTLVELAAVGEIVLHGYICLGAVNWHKHIDNDEVFLVYDGVMALESEWGQVVLRPSELVVIKKGIAHRSGSQLRTVVVLMHARGLPERKNGHRRIYGIPGQGQLKKIRLLDVAALAAPFRLEPVTRVDDFTLQLARGDGLSPTYLNSLSDTLWLTISGQAQFEANDEAIEMAHGELVVVSRETPHRWIGFGPTTMLWLGLTRPIT